MALMVESKLGLGEGEEEGERLGQGEEGRGSGGGEEEEVGAGGEGEEGPVGSAEGCGWGAMVIPGQGEEEEEDEDEEQEERLASWKSLCSWLFTMLFMALCISANILCFSRFGIRPKRTAAGGGGDVGTGQRAHRPTGEQTDSRVSHRHGSCPQTDTS